MKKFLAKLTVFTLIISMCVAFSACSSKTNAGNSENTESTSATEPTSNDTTSNTDVSSTKGTTAGTTVATSSTKQKTTIAEGTSLSKNQALDLLDDHYGNNYEVNGSTVDKNNYYVKVIKKGESQPTYKVTVNLSNGNATQTELASGKTSSFSLN